VKRKIKASTIIGSCLLLCLLLAFAPDTADTKENPGPDKTIVLTFDDGPRPAALKELLPVLEKYNVPATFFMEGAIVAKNQELVRKMSAEGYEIENHSFGHENLRKLFKEKGPAAIKSSLGKTAEAIFKATGRQPQFFRPPFWEINEEIEKIIVAEGYIVIKLGKPDINCLDYEDAAKRRSPEILIDRVKKLILDHEQQGKITHILVFHELELTAKALDILIPYWQSEGYKFSRLDQSYLQPRQN
jgi:peptidoglycan/xylan/chitin deacetylase (PgdA/CDA1 family)